MHINVHNIDIVQAVGKTRTRLFHISQCHKIGKHIHRSDVQVTFELYRSFIPNKTAFTKYCLTQWIPKLIGSFEIHWVRQCLINFTGMAGKVNDAVDKTEPIVTGLGYGKLSYFLTLLYYGHWRIRGTGNQAAYGMVLNLFSRNILPLGLKFHNS